ncbi:UNVERIFIED_CONTAM: hypothetical protein Scaly_2430900 [Sesamum calycinum]|uniref:Retrotransposon gag domain-containing protein n=1 Tax=Sesamum calycinum TaxID=2727403 RepID=A0AAW2M1Z6_9LAMI
MRPQGVTEEQVKLRAFPFSLGDKAKDWLYSLPSGTIVSWNELKKQFLENYFPASRTTNIRKDISGIRQFSGESFYEYWGRFKQLVESCPHHQIPDHLLIQYFYEGLFEANRSLVDAASGGALYDKTPTEARKLITTMAANNQQFGNRSDNPPRKVHEVSTSVDERLDKLTFLVEKILVGGTQQVKACGICTSSGHFTDACPTLQEEPTIHANAVGGFSGPSQRGHDPFSNTYNPGWRDHPNLRYGNQPQNSQRPPYQQPPPPQTNSNSGDSSKHSKFGVSSEPISLLRQSFGVPSKLPSQTIINPKQNVSAITMCSEKELQFENSTRRGQAQQGKTEDSIERGHVEQGKTGEKFKILPKQAEKPNLTHEEHPKVFVPKPPFPERFAKSKKKEEERDS